MRAAIALIPLALLAACNDAGTVDKKNASTAEVAKSVADAGMKLNPGRWELTMQFKKFEVEDMPPEAKAMMQKMLGETRTFASCLTKEEAEKPDGKFFGQQGEDCKYDTFTMGNGKIDATMVFNGVIAGLVSITAEPLTPTIGQAVLIGAVGGVRRAEPAIAEGERAHEGWGDLRLSHLVEVVGEYRYRIEVGKDILAEHHGVCPRQGNGLCPRDRRIQELDAAIAPLHAEELDPGCVIVGPVWRGRGGPVLAVPGETD